MKKSMEIQKTFFREPAVVGEICFELTEDDFLLAKTPQSLPDILEDDE